MQLGAEVCLILLLFGNLCGDLCLLADMGSIAAHELFPGGPPGWLVAGGGRALMAALAATIVFPLSCVRHMREVGAGQGRVVGARAVQCVAHARGGSVPALAG